MQDVFDQRRTTWRKIISETIHKVAPNQETRRDKMYSVPDFVDFAALDHRVIVAVPEGCLSQTVDCVPSTAHCIL